MRAIAEQGHARWGRLGAAGGLALLMALALAIRALGFEFVFVADEVVFAPADAQYHLRRAFYTFVNFPAVLLFDPYINYPGGAPVPWPPLFDFVLGGAARLLADDVRGFERVAAWAGPACAVLTLFPIYLSGKLLASRGAGLAAAFVYAGLPIGVAYSRVGNPDHHAVVAMFGAWLLLACLGLAETGASSRRLRSWGFVLGAAQLGLLLSWHGSLLYVALANALLLGVGIVGGRAAGLLAQASAAAACGLLLMPLLLVSPEPLGGRFSSVAPSWLQVLATLAVAGVSGVLWLGERWAPGGGMRRRAVLAGGAVVAILAGAALSAEIREALGTALGFLAQADRVGAVTGEQNPLFGAWDRMPAARPTYAWGWFVYAIPFAPAAAAWLGLSPRARPGTVASALLLAGWTFFFGVLALDQGRYGNDFAPAFALLFGVVAVRAMARLTSRLPASKPRAAARAIGVIVLGLALLWPAIHVVYGPRARGSLNALQGSGKPRPDVMRSVAYTLTRFMAEVRRVTPETSGYMSPGPPPAYGVIAHPNLGHALQYGARRAASTDPFWWYIGPENWETSFAFLEARTEADALRSARALKARYVLTSVDEDPRTVAGQLYAHDGRATARRPPLVHFRLISESPPGGKAVSEIFRPRAGNGIAYKLFEIVPGARLIVEAAPGEEVEVSLKLRSSQGRAFSYRAVARAGANGEASLRVPYATEPSRLPEAGPRTHALGLYRVEVAGSVEAASVSEEAVVVGARVHARGRRSGSRPPASGL